MAANEVIFPVIAAGDSALAKVTMIPSKSVGFFIGYPQGAWFDCKFEKKTAKGNVLRTLGNRTRSKAKYALRRIALVLPLCCTP